MILASASPRRHELLVAAGYDITIAPTDIDETPRPGESPCALVRRLATSKAHACLDAQGTLPAGELILAADTVVWDADQTLGKPHDADDARRMLRSLSAKTHHVSTGVCIIRSTGSGVHESSFVETTDVTFRKLSDAEIDAFVATGEPLDKAGSYGIQGGAGVFVERLDGDYDNVVGLPVARVEEALADLRLAHEPQSITQIPGILAGHMTDEVGRTGCTVIVCPYGATGAVDVRGGAPATRETDLLRPEETVQTINAVVLSGGSAFGLAASCGVADELERADIGVDMEVTHVPIVSGACLFDLYEGDPHARPTVEDGALAARAALAERDVPASRRTPLPTGRVGAGTGCTVGKLAGIERSMPSGLGEQVERSGSLVCGAVVAVNTVGDVVDPDTHEAIAGLLTEDGACIADSARFMSEGAASLSLDRTNTTISCVVTNARLTKAEATKVAQMASDAYAHALRPAHTTYDGDTVFVMATGVVDAQVNAVGTLATRALERAIANAARESQSPA